MFANRYTALVDACSLAGVLGRNMLLTLAEADFFRIRWSAMILDETERAVASMMARKGRSDAAQAARHSRLCMEQAFPEAMVTDFDQFLPIGSTLPDREDAHVLAAAMKTQAQTIVTENIKDFPPDILSPLAIEARTLDEFLADAIALDEGRAMPAIREMRARLSRPDISAASLLIHLEKNGLLQTTDLLGQHVRSI